MEALTTLQSFATGPIAHMSKFRKVIIPLIRPSGYLENGFVRMFRRGFIPSNSHAVMRSLFRGVCERFGIPHEIYTFDDAIGAEHYAMHRLMEELSERQEQRTLVLAVFVGVQSHELPRARDLSRQWMRSCNATAIMGGFGISGPLRTLYWGIKDSRRKEFPGPDRTVLPREIQELVDDGIVLFDGEAESPKFTTMFGDLLHECPQPIYYEADGPDITHAPMPEYALDGRKNLVGTTISTIDPSRGCPFICSFCSIINFRGRDVRAREPARIVEHLKELCRTHGSAHVFFTDDNFARSRRCKELLELLATARREGYDITSMLELDTKSILRMPELANMCKSAGVTTVFAGIESMNPANNADAQILKNDIPEFRRFADAMAGAGIATHAGYIIGFPHDTPALVCDDVDRLSALFDVASFFYLTPVPGSQDHASAVRDGIPMDDDLNRYNSFGPVIGHSTMSKAEWVHAYEDAWKIFYRPERMIEHINAKSTAKQKFSLLGNYMLWRLGQFVYGVHPMISGLGQQWDYHDRRPNAPSLSRYSWLPNALAGRIFVGAHRMKVACRLFSEFRVFKRVILESGLVPIAIRVTKQELEGELEGVRDWMRRTFLEHPTRHWLNTFWARYASEKKRLFWDLGLHARAAAYATSEIICWLRVTCSLENVHEPWLKSFWRSYRHQGIRLFSPFNLGRHLVAIPLLITEIVDQIKFISYIFPRIMKEIERA